MTMFIKIKVLEEEEHRDATGQKEEQHNRRRKTGMLYNKRIDNRKKKSVQY